MTTYDVVTPTRGGTYPFGVTYTVNGEQREVDGLTFSYESLSRAECIAPLARHAGVGRG